MEDANRRGQSLVPEVRVELRQVGGHHQALVDDIRLRKAAHIEVTVSLQGDFGTATGEEQLDPEITRRQPFASDEYLLDARQPIQRQAAEYARVDRHFAPADERQPLRGDLLIDGVACSVGLVGLTTEKDHADRVALGERRTEGLLSHGTQKGIGFLHQQTTAISGLAVGIDAAAVGHAGERLNCGL